MSTRWKTGGLVAIGGFLLSLTAEGGKSPPASPERYAVQILPTPPGLSGGIVKAINGRGEAVGGAGVSGTPWAGRALLWRAGKPILLKHPPDYKKSAAIGINDRGEIAGAVDNSGSGAYSFVRSRACIWREGRIHLLPKIEIRPDSFTTAINGKGEVVGWEGNTSYPPSYDAGDPEQQPHAFLYRNGAKIDLGLGREAFINDRGQVAYNYESSMSVRDLSRPEVMAYHSVNLSDIFLWEDGRKKLIGLGRARGLNNRGWIVGSFDVIGLTPRNFRAGNLTATRASLWREGKRTDLGTLGGRNSAAAGVNDRGQVVGYSEVPPPGGATQREAVRHAFLWERGRMIDLNRRLPKGSGWVLHEADAINARGQIIGTGAFRGKARPFLLTPSKSSSIYPKRIAGLTHLQGV